MIDFFGRLSRKLPIRRISARRVLQHRARASDNPDFAAVPRRYPQRRTRELLLFFYSLLELRLAFVKNTRARYHGETGKRRHEHRINNRRPDRWLFIESTREPIAHSSRRQILSPSRGRAQTEVVSCRTRTYRGDHGNRITRFVFLRPCDRLSFSRIVRSRRSRPRYAR